ncbi:MAG TPA: hypothetical protein VGO69_07690, partial [Pyrinomonadaceae bacterium]|nr:hypothetical protein [Pyrinomonadaceae bacterium]
MLTVRTWVLLIVAALLIAAGALNFLQRLKHKSPPTDGVIWTQTKDGVVAETVNPDSAAGRAQILPGDVLLGISEDEYTFDQVTEPWQVPVYLEEAGVGGHLVYRIYRPSNPEETRYYDADLYDLQNIPDWTSRDLYINLIGLIYLFVGFFVLFKQGGRAPFVLHFATLCLVAFVFHFYRPIGTGEDLDAAIDFLDNAALALFAPIFVHFCAL